jgi:hypothetical protein
MPFERTDWKPQPEHMQPWRQWHYKVDQHKDVATDQELAAKPWLKARDSATPHDVAFIQNNEFYKDARQVSQELVSLQPGPLGYHMYNW